MLASAAEHHSHNRSRRDANQQHVIEADTGFSGVPLFQKGLLAALNSTNTVGTIDRPGGGGYEVHENTGVTYTRRLFSNKYLADKLPSTPLRICDAAAKKIDSWPDVPRFELYWNTDERDAAIAQYVRLIETEGPAFSRRAAKENK